MIQFLIFLVCLCNCSVVWQVYGYEFQENAQENCGNIGIKKQASSFGSLGFTSNADVTDKIFVDYFIALPAELKLIILGYLSPKDLFDFIHIENLKEYHHLAIEAYGTVYGDTVLSIRNAKKKRNFHLENNIIHFYDLSKFQTALRVFKKKIRNLRIDLAAFLDYELNETVAIISEFSNALTRLELRNIYEDDLDVIQTVSFPKIKELAFFNCEFDSHKMVQLKGIFPNVRRFSSISNQAEDPKWVERNFSNLTHLILEVSRKFHRESDVLQILNRNPELISLSVHWPTPNLLRTINEQFSNIVNLAFIAYANDFMGIAEINMKHIETFSFDGLIDFPMAITFENLKELRWSATSDPEDDLLNFIQKHKNTLERIEIRDADFLDEHLEKINNMTQLERFAISFLPDAEDSITAEGLFDFIRNNRKLSEVQLKEVQQYQRVEVFLLFNVSGLAGNMEVFDPWSPDQGDIYFRRGVKETKRNDPMQFFKSHSFRK